MGKVTIEEKALFYDEIQILTQGFYQYMHGERTQPDGATTLFKRFADFYDADWVGLLDVDCNFESWSAKCFYNAVTGSTTETLIGKPERFATAPSWVDAVRTGKPIIVEDIEDIKALLPSEYEMYKRLEVNSVIGVPYKNIQMGLMVVKNPKRFKSEALALNVMSYISTMETIAVNRRKNMERRTEPDEPSRYEDVRIKLFGDFSIQSKNMLLTAEDVQSEPVRFAIAYMTVNKGMAFPPEKLSSVYSNGESVASWKDILYRFRCKCRVLRPDLEHELCDLIAQKGNKGYSLSEVLNFSSDVDAFEEAVKCIDDTVNTETKISALEDFYIQFQGDFLPGETECEWILTTRQDYRKRYIEKMVQMLQLLHDRTEYASAANYATDLLKRFPHSVEIRFWQTVSYWEMRKADVAKSAIDAGKEILMDHEWEMFIELLEKHHICETEKKYIKDCINLDKE